MSTEQEKYANESQAEGSWKREPTKFQDVISRDPAAKYPPEKNRYRLYVNYACPWAHRTILVRKLKGLENVIPITFTDYVVKYMSHTMDKRYKGWLFKTEDGLNNNNSADNPFYEPHGFETLSELYELALPGFSEQYYALNKNPSYSVPVLFDEKTQTIVNNESAEIIKMLNSELNEFADNAELNLEPEELQAGMAEYDAIVYPKINDGVYRCGFAQTQGAYNDAYKAHWEGMEAVEKRLGESRYLAGDKLTLSDIRLFVTLIRYDAVYFSLFKTSKKRVRDMPNLFRFVKEIFNWPGVSDTMNLPSFVKAYFGGVTGIYPLGPLESDYLDYLKN
jgi:putative glutathione S-transferase